MPINPRYLPSYDSNWNDGKLRGRGLRYTVSLLLRAARGPMSVRDIVEGIQADGVPIDGRPGKTVSDALRWEIRRGRVVQVGRGKYLAGAIPESTLRYMRNWLLEADPHAFVPSLRKSLVASTLREPRADARPDGWDAPLPRTADGAINLDLLDPNGGDDDS